MFRAIIKKRVNLDLAQIKDIPVLSASISEDLTQKATSTIYTVEAPSGVSLNDIIGIYNYKGEFIYWGVISAISENKITVQQFNALFNDTHLLVPQTSNYQKSFFNTKPISYVIDLYLKSKELGYQSTVNSMSSGLVPTYSGLIDKDVADNFKGITHTIIDTDETFMPYPQERESKNLETFLYDIFKTYNRIIRPVVNLSLNTINIVMFYPTGLIEYEAGKTWDYNEIQLFDGWERISNLSIIKEDEDTNVVAIYNDAGTSLRGSYTMLEDGTVQQITSGTSVEGRIGSNKTKFVFDSNNNLTDLAKANLPNLQYNHKISFNINFDGEYKFNDFNLAKPIKFYSTKDNIMFSSILSARSYEIVENSDEIQNAAFTLGKVRTDLTSKLNKTK